MRDATKGTLLGRKISDGRQVTVIADATEVRINDVHADTCICLDLLGENAMELCKQRKGSRLFNFNLTTMRLTENNVRYYFRWNLAVITQLDIAASSTATTTPQVPVNWWWVNQNQTYADEIAGSFLWSPKTKSDGKKNQFYDFMRQVRAGDIIFSYCDTFIKAIGIATGPAVSAPKPDFEKISSNWSNDGWHVPVEFVEIAQKVRPKDHIGKLRKHLPEKYSPLQQNGNGLQSVYLAHVPASMAEVLISLLGSEYESVVNTAQEKQEENFCNNLELLIEDRTDIGPTMKEQLVKARRGQGLFKIRVRRQEKSCRVTGVADLRNLRASHIKPWKDCSDQERLSGYNGLMLAPHVDHLFDRGFISFTDNGDLIISPGLDPTILARWGIPEVLNVGSLDKQARFLAYHRQFVLKK